MHKQKINQQYNEELLERIFKPTGNIAFLDAEFNAGMDYSSGENLSEVISIGLIICDAHYKELHRFYTLVNPMSGKKVFPMITKMTGITTDMLKGQPGFAAVSAKITDLIHQYEVWDVFAWGNADKASLMKERNRLKMRRYASAEALARWTYIDLCTDISTVVSTHLLGIRGGLAINMENLMFVCEITDKQEHNALSDADYLYQCMRYLLSHYPVQKGDLQFKAKKEVINSYYQERSTYNSFRRFRSTSRGNDLYGKWGLTDAEKDMRIRALEDDLKFLKGEIPYETEFPDIETYFSDKLK